MWQDLSKSYQDPPPLSRSLSFQNKLHNILNFLQAFVTIFTFERNVDHLLLHENSFLVQNLRIALTKAEFILVLVIPYLFYEWVALKKAVQLKRFRLALIRNYIARII